MAALPRLPITGTTLRMLLAVGILYLIMMGSTFSSLGVVLPHMIASLRMSWGEAGFGFTLLALAAGLSSPLPAETIKRWGGRVTMLMGVLTLMAAYAVMAVCSSVAIYDVGAILLGIGFSLVGAVTGLHILSGWEDRKRSLVFGLYLGFGGLGGLTWPSVVQASLAAFGDWRGYWWFMTGLMAVVGAVTFAIIRERPIEDADADRASIEVGWTLRDALRTPQFYVIGCAIAATYLVATTVNAFTTSYLTLIGVSMGIAVLTFSIQSGCHAAFPIIMSGLAQRVGVKWLLILGLAMQAVGMTALVVGSSPAVLVIFAIGVGGGYGTTFLATTLSLQDYFGRRHYAAIFGANQLFTTISVVGPVIAGWVADRTGGRFDVSFAGGVVLLVAAAVATVTLRPPGKRADLMAPTGILNIDAPH